MWEYRAEILRVVDGDTLDVLIDLGFEVVKRERVRLSELNAPEQTTGPGRESTQFVKDWADREVGIPVPEKGEGRYRFTLRSRRPSPRDKFHRYLAEIVGPSGESLNEALIASGMAEPE